MKNHRNQPRAGTETKKVIRQRKRMRRKVAKQLGIETNRLRWVGGILYRVHTSPMQDDVLHRPGGEPCRHLPKLGRRAFGWIGTGAGHAPLQKRPPPRGDGADPRTGRIPRMGGNDPNYDWLAY